MGTITFREIRKPEEMRQLKAGPISILTGKNLRTASEASSTKPSATPNDSVQKGADKK